MNSINNLLVGLDGYLGGSFWFPFLLIGAGLLFTIYLGVPQFRYFGKAWAILFEPKTKKSAGETSHFQALSTALSGTVGTGNIGGVSFAIFLGGPAALFWMWVTAFLGMTTKMVEVTLSHKYREMTEDGTVAGGPMYFIDKGLKWKWMAILFALATVASSFGSGSLPQINNIAQVMHFTFGIEHALTGAVLAVLLGLVIVGGIRRIAVVTSTIIPTMGLLYLFGALTVISLNYENIIPSFIAVFSDAFTGSAAVGGFLGASFAFAFNRGVNRGIYSNEAGQGSAAIAHASAKTEEPVSEGIVALLEPFIDTIIICTLTGLVILSTGVWTQKFDNKFQQSETYFISGQYIETNDVQQQKLFNFLDTIDIQSTNEVQLLDSSITIVDGKMQNTDVTIIHSRSIAEQVVFLRQEDDQPFNGNIQIKGGRLAFDEIYLSGRSLIHSASLTSEAFAKGFLGDYGRYIIAITLLLFAFSTAIAWSYYGDRAITYLVGVKGVMPYRIVYVIAFFVASFTDTVILWNFAAITIVLMAIPNIIGFTLMHKEMKQLVRDYDKQ